MRPFAGDLDVETITGEKVSPAFTENEGGDVSVDSSIGEVAGDDSSLLDLNTQVSLKEWRIETVSLHNAWER